jgi:hypothetical protein
MYTCLACGLVLRGRLDEHGMVRQVLYGMMSMGFGGLGYVYLGELE